MKDEVEAGPAHTVRSFEEELTQLANIVVRMGGLAEVQFANAIRSVVRRDSELAERTLAGDRRLDEIEQEVHTLTLRLLALRQPVADDLRTIIASLKVSSDLERIGDYAANVAKRAMVLNQLPPVRPVMAIPQMGRLVQAIIKDVLDAFIERDVDKAADVWSRDKEVDELNVSMFRELLTYMMEDPRNITPCTHLLFIAKNIERIGDHAANIAETVHFIAAGKSLTTRRPKGVFEGSVDVGPQAGSWGGGGAGGSWPGDVDPDV